MVVQPMGCPNKTVRHGFSVGQPSAGDLLPASAVPLRGGGRRRLLAAAAAAARDDGGSQGILFSKSLWDYDDLWWFVMTCELMMIYSWLMMIYDYLWLFIHDLWWFMMLYDDLFITYWWFMMICDELWWFIHDLWWFMMICDDLRPTSNIDLWQFGPMIMVKGLLKQPNIGISWGKNRGTFDGFIDVYRLSRLRQESSGSRAVGRGDPEVCATQFAHSFRVRNAQICTYAHIQRDTRTCIYNSHTHIYITNIYAKTHTQIYIHIYTCILYQQ